MESPHSHRILVVDDDPALLEAIVCYLEHKGFAVDGAQGGTVALARLRLGERPCVIVTDALMPGMDGWALVAAIRDASELAGIPIVMTSGYPEQVSRALAVGVRAYLPKPMDPEQLAEAIVRYCPCVAK